MPRIIYTEGLDHRLNGQHTVIARIRRGKYVLIPSEWRGKTTNSRTIRKRQSKRHRKRGRGRGMG